LESILFIALASTIAGGESWVDMETFGEEKHEWLAKFLDLSEGVPSHDTFSRVFAMLDCQVFESCFQSWIQNVYQVTEGEIVALDGKTIRRSHDRTHGPLHLVNAWAHQNRLVLGQVECDEKSNEIKAIPKLLEMLSLQGCIVTLDAMGTQKEIAEKIRDRGADYVLALKGNHGVLHQEVQDYWNDSALPKSEYKVFETVEKDHGRYEIRRCRVSQKINWLAAKSDWKDLKTIVWMESERHEGDKISKQSRYYLSSLEAHPQKLAQAIRAHWGVENKVHWTLDVCFREDHNRTRQKQAVKNTALLRRFALNVIRRDTQSKRSLRSRRLAAAFSHTYLEKILASF
jgi:predicted transposase YbfD/YdcC